MLFTPSGTKPPSAASQTLLGPLPIYDHIGPWILGLRVWESWLLPTLDRGSRLGRGMSERKSGGRAEDGPHRRAGVATHSPTLGSGLQLLVQGHGEAEQTVGLAFLAQGAHHIQIEGNSPLEEQSQKQRANKVASPRDPPRIAAPNPGHEPSQGRAARKCKEIPTCPRVPRAPALRRPGASLVSRVWLVPRASSSLSPRHGFLPRPSGAPAPARANAAAAAPVSTLASASPPGGCGGGHPGPAQTPPLAPAAGGELSARSREMPRPAAPGGGREDVE